MVGGGACICVVNKLPEGLIDRGCDFIQNILSRFQQAEVIQMS